MNLQLPLCLGLLAAPALAQQSQYPSPLVEHTRAHPRLKKEKQPGLREKMDLGTLFVPARVKLEGKIPLFIHFHGGTWIPEVAAARHGKTAVLSIQIGSGSGVYAKAFADPRRFGKLLKEVEARLKVKCAPVTLTAWSAGYGAVREILAVPEYHDRVGRVLLIDGLHTGYVTGKPGPRESRLQEKSLEVFLKFARAAVTGKKQLIVTHSEIFPGTYASTTETADYLLKHLGLKRCPVLRWGPMQTQQLSEVRRGKFYLAGFAGNSAPDHVDQLHSLPDYLKWFDGKPVSYPAPRCERDNR
jgi:hypothetical protein